MMTCDNPELKRYDHVDRAQVRAKESIQKHEDLEVFKILSRAVLKAEKLVESLFEIEDYTNPDHWPEWRVTNGNGVNETVKAETAAQAIEIVTGNKI